MADSKQTSSSGETKAVTKSFPKTGKRSAKGAKAFGNKATPFSRGHTELHTNFDKLSKASAADREAELEALLDSWGKHSQMFSTMLQDAADADLQAAIDEVAVSHDLVHILMTNLGQVLQDDPIFAAVSSALHNELKRAMSLEKRPPIAGAVKTSNASEQDEGDTGPAMSPERTLQLKILQMGQSTTPRRSKQKEDYAMSADRMRDERGRFTDEDDYGRGRSRHDEDRRYSSSSGRSRSDDDDPRGGYRSRSYSESPRGGSDMRRDESRYDYDNRSSGSRNQGRYEDDDDDRRGGRRQGGWFGDSEGHSRAARGQSMSGGSSSRYQDENDDYNRGRSRSSRDDDDDDRRYSSSGRGQGQGGWFGDSEGHSQASRRGWEHRRDDDDDDRRRR